jgi:hypothetical protein
MATKKAGENYVETSAQIKEAQATLQKIQEEVKSSSKTSMLGFTVLNGLNSIVTG